MPVEKKINGKSIKNWPEDDRPREKLLRKGAHTLSNTELLAILLRTGTPGESAIELARGILEKFKNFRNMSQADIRDWKEFKGMGQAKIAELKATMEIARRFNDGNEKERRPMLNYTEEVVELFKARMRDLKNEVMKVILCDARNRIINEVEVAKGTPNESHPYIREIISKALQNFAIGIICVHNHPGGEPAPSRSDIIFNDALKDTCKMMNLKLLDHIIFGEDAYYSFDKTETKEY